jgi:16S rRNA (adenine1518-N6/adenine1519-N6)-dimethyltransferase
MNVPSIPLARLRAELEAAGAPPRKRHGQNFLHDGNLLAAIVRDAEVGATDTVLEIGAGPGLLTRHLLATGARVIAVEIDPRVRIVAGHLIEPEWAERLEWIEADVLASHHVLAPEVVEVLPRCDAVVSNLPYNIAAVVIANLLTEPVGPDRLVCMVQREVGDRLLADCGSRDFGSLGALSALCAEGRQVRKVPPAAFWPKPHVDSVVVRLDRRADRPQGEALQRVQAFLEAAFHTRRKTLVNSVALASGRPAAEVAEILGLAEKSEKRRAEAFEPLQLSDLAQRWGHATSGHKRS